MTTFQNFYLDSVRGRPSAQAFNALVCIYSLLQNKMNDYFKPFKITAVQFNSLMLIRHMGGEKGISQNDICRHLIVSPSNITRLIDRLIKDGYAQRTVSGEDRRIKLIKITPEGAAVLDKVFYGYGEMIQQSVYLLPRKDVEVLSPLLLKWFLKLDEPQQKEQQ